MGLAQQVDFRPPFLPTAAPSPVLDPTPNDEESGRALLKLLKGDAPAGSDKENWGAQPESENWWAEGWWGAQNWWGSEAWGAARTSGVPATQAM